QGATVDQGMIVSLFPVNAIWVNSYRQPIATPQKDLPILAYIAAGLFAIVRIYCATLANGLLNSWYFNNFSGNF
ncbi:hypothetical protein ACK369_19945, partial [Aeromonas veronii]